MMKKFNFESKILSIEKLKRGGVEEVVKIQIKILSKTGQKIINLNRRRAIREHCLNCSGYSRAEVHRCPVTSCPLFHYRSGKGKQDAKARKKAIREYCLWCCAEQRFEMLNCTARDCSLFPFRKSSLDRSVDLSLNSKKTLIGAVSEANN